MAENAEKIMDRGRLRLDPYQSFHRLKIADKSYRLDPRGAVIRKTLSCGLPISMALPARAFQGVAARAVEEADGQTTVTLELLHKDPQLCVPLLCANDMDDVAADWHSWSRLMKLPMLMVSADGGVSPVQKLLGRIMLEEPIRRRKRITNPKQRPSFLRRRKLGRVSEIEKLEAHEIIARN